MRRKGGAEGEGREDRWVRKRGRGKLLEATREEGRGRKGS